MTVKRRIFLSNTLMVLSSLIILFAIGISLISIFKGEFLNLYRNNSKLDGNYEKIYSSVMQLQKDKVSWTKWQEVLDEYDYNILVKNQENKTIFSNINHSEKEAIESLIKLEKAEEISTYLMEGATILTTTTELQGEVYNLYIVKGIKNTFAYGIDRGMFEMFIIVFSIVGIISIVAILLCSQMFTKLLIRKILKPIKELDLAAKRIAMGDLSQEINYNYKDEFTNLCESFNFMQAHLKEGIEQKAAYERARIEMVSGISHDLRTPLTSVKGYIKGMIDGVASTEKKQKEYLEIAYRKSCEMEKLISRLFYFSKLETGNMPFFKETTNMERFLKNYVKQKTAELLEKGVDISLVSALKKDSFCNIDKEQIIRVFNNLVENSLKYAKDSNKLEIEINLKKQEDNLIIDFVDNGLGVSQDKLESIFEQFYRIDESRNSSKEGNGLGLYVCRYIIKEHGGNIYAYNKNGFHIEISLPEMKGDGM